MRRRQLTFLAVTVVAALGLLAPAGAAAHNKRGIEHIVVVYQENHSFDNLYGGWEGVNGLGKADRAHTVQVDQDGEPYDCLRQDDVNLTSPPLAADCDPTSHFRNRPFSIDDFIAPMDTTCPPPGVFALNGVAKGEGLEGGCTRDLVHRFYQEQYQLHGGKQDRYVTGSDALGLTMGTYDTRELPIYRYLHRPAIRATRSPTTSSRRPSAGRSSITSGWPPRPLPSGRVPSTTAAATTSTRWSTPTACRSATRSTPRQRGRT